VLIDGNTRTQAALAAGITQAPVVTVRFDRELKTLLHVIKPQVDRRTTTDGALYRLCAQFDRLMARGGDRRIEEAK
jgi:hypothetical protein